MNIFRMWVKKATNVQQGDREKQQTSSSSVLSANLNRFEDRPDSQLACGQKKVLSAKNK